jgi:hypothetical protein
MQRMMVGFALFAAVVMQAVHAQVGGFVLPFEFMVQTWLLAASHAPQEGLTHRFRINACSFSEITGGGHHAVVHGLWQPDRRWVQASFPDSESCFLLKRFVRGWPCLMLYEFTVAGPLNAIVAAQSQAAMATVDFIYGVGFDAAGKSINLDFSYNTTNPATGLRSETTLSVPMLTIVPIPVLRVRGLPLPLTR